MDNNKVSELRRLTNVGIIECSKALKLFDDNIIQAKEYIEMKSHAVCRRKSDGQLWKVQDYVDYIKKEFSLDN